MGKSDFPHAPILGLVLSTTLLSNANAEDHSYRDLSSSDARCILVGLKLGETAEPSQKQAGLLLTAFYAGRIHGRTPTLSLENLILKQFKTFAMSDFESEANRCAVGLSEEGQEISEIGKDLAEKQQKSASKSDPNHA